MKVVFTDEALRDLDEIFQYISENYPAVYDLLKSVYGQL